MNKFMLLLFSLVLVSCSNTAVQDSKQKILVHGHRGARAKFPENTLSAFKYALDIGVDVLEFDLAVTKDQHLIVSHDPHANSIICNVPKELNGPFYKLTLKQVKSLDCGSKANPRFPKQKRVAGEKIPTLSEVFELAKKNKNILFNIETKIFPFGPELTPAPKGFAKLVVGAIEKHNVADRVIIQSFDYRTLKEVKKLNPKIKTAQLTYQNLIDLGPSLKSMNIEYLSPNHHWITKEIVENLKAQGIKTAPWTANDPKEWRKLVDMGVDGIITDDPEGLIRFFKENGLR